MEVPHGVPDTAFAKSPPFTGPAVVKYGQAALQSAYKEMVNFAFATGWNSVLIARNSAYLSRADLAVAASYMTAAARKDLLATLAKVTQGDKVGNQQTRRVDLLRSVGRVDLLRSDRLGRTEVGAERQSCHKPKIHAGIGRCRYYARDPTGHILRRQR